MSITGAEAGREQPHESSHRGAGWTGGVTEPSSSRQQNRWASQFKKTESAKSLVTASVAGIFSYTREPRQLFMYQIISSILWASLIKDFLFCKTLHTIFVLTTL